MPPVAVSPLLLATVITAGTLDAWTGPMNGLEHARPRPRVEDFWLGLPSAADHASTLPGGIVVLRPPPSRRVRIHGGKYSMGSTTQEMRDAVDLCTKEPTGTLLRCGGHRDRRPDAAADIAPMILAEGYVHEVTLDDFAIDATEVTVESYERCVVGGACLPPSFLPGDARYDRPKFPVTHVTWDDAARYCAWAGGRLPTEAEWELAARGHDNNTFPWGKIYSPRLANHGSLAADRSDGRDGFLGLAPVGSFPDGATPTGLLDMAGNAAEWVADWYERDEEGYGYKRAAQTNPKGPPFGVYGHVVRGGSYLDPGFFMRTAARDASIFAQREIGFRCAADLR